jgi:hypothetical protein
VAVVVVFMVPVWVWIDEVNAILAVAACMQRIWNKSTSQVDDDGG